MATNEELEKRIESLEGCVSALQSFQINLYNDALKKRDDAHNALWETVYEFMKTYGNGHKDFVYNNWKLMDNARLSKDDRDGIDYREQDFDTPQEAQDGVSEKVVDSVDGGNSFDVATVDALMAQMEESFKQVLFANKSRAMRWVRFSAVLRPTITELVRERDEAERNSASINDAMNDLIPKFKECNDRAERAEAELEQTQYAGKEYKELGEAYLKLEQERDGWHRETLALRKSQEESDKEFREVRDELEADCMEALRAYRTRTDHFNEQVDRADRLERMNDTMAGELSDVKLENKAMKECVDVLPNW